MSGFMEQPSRKGKERPPLNPGMFTYWLEEPVAVDRGEGRYCSCGRKLNRYNPGPCYQCKRKEELEAANKTS